MRRWAAAPAQRQRRRGAASQVYGVSQKACAWVKAERSNAWRGQAVCVIVSAAGTAAEQPPRRHQKNEPSLITPRCCKTPAGRRHASAVARGRGPYAREVKAAKAAAKMRAATGVRACRADMNAHQWRAPRGTYVARTT